jgi:hypothetical protein
MSKQRKPSGSSKPPTPLPTRPGIPRAIPIGSALMVAAALGFWWWNSKTNNTPPVVPPSAETVATNLPPVVAGLKPANPEFQQLKGKWLRPDGGYVIEVRSIDDRGKVDAAYFNPKPIHVARAEASLNGALTKLFIELRDVNYPGSTYTLAYNPAADQLAGIYYQALQQQSFEVVFVRMP